MGQLEQEATAEPDVKETAARPEIDAVERRLDELAVPPVQGASHDRAAEPAPRPGKLIRERRADRPEEPEEERGAQAPPPAERRAAARSTGDRRGDVRTPATNASDRRRDADT